MAQPRNGFSLIELLLVLGLIGIISGIAIPQFLGQRKRARMIGDAKSNAQVLAMQLESRRADLGVYASSKQQEGSSKYTWIAGTPSASAAALLPGFTPKGNSIMNFELAIGSTLLTYDVIVKDPTKGGVKIMSLNQSGSIWTAY